MKKVLLKALICVSLIFNFQFSIINSALAQDSVFSYTHQGTTLYYVINSQGGAMLVPPLWPYYDEENDASWTGYTMPTGDVAVPDSVPFDGTMHAVTEVGHDAFYRCNEVTSITLPATVSTFGEYSFGMCHALTSVNIPEGVTEIPFACFWNDHQLASVSLPASLTYIDAWAFAKCFSLTSITIPEGITEILYNCFYNDTLLAEVSLPEGLTLIDDDAFNGCSVLQTINFPSSLRTIGHAAFKQCAGPQMVSLPDGLTTIGEQAFYHCDSIRSVAIPGSVHTISTWAFGQCGNLSFVQLGEGVDTIGFAAFWSCVNLLYISYPSTLKVIGDFAFQYDGALGSNLILPEGFTSMGVTAYGDNQSLITASLPGTMATVTEEVFWGCTSLSKVTLGEGIETIGDKVFVNCPSLHILTLPASLNSIGDSVFLGNTRIDTLVFRSSVPPSVPNSDSIFTDFHTLLVVPQGSMATYSAHPYWGRFMNIVEVFPYTHQGTTLYYLVGDEGNASLVPPLFPFNVPSSVSGSTAEAWEGYTKPVGAVTVPDSVPYLGTMHAVTAVADQTFRRCGEITSVALPSSVAFLGSYAFYSCSAMQSVNIPDGVSRIPYACFAGCYALQSADVPASVSVIDEFGFLLCSDMQTLTLHQGLDTIGRRAFCRCLALEHITLPEGLRCIDHQAFEQDTNLRHINLPSSLEMVGGDAFRDNLHLDSVIFPDGMTYLYNGVLMNCSSLTYVHLPQNLEVMESLLLKGTGLETFTVPQHVRAIGYQTFAECPRLHKVALPASVTDLYWSLFDNSPIDTLILECAVPPTLHSDRSHGTFQEYTATLIVPCGSADTYRADSLWGQFPTIVESCNDIEDVRGNMEDVRVYSYNGRIIVEGADNETVSVYDMLGHITQTFKQSSNQAIPSGVYLVKVGERPAQKVVVVK